MELYTRVAYETSRTLTLRYSTSFSISSSFFGKTIKPHIYAIYGLVRIADEIVDTYNGSNAASCLDMLETEVYTAIKTGFSTNITVHAFADTARRFGISKAIISPFFESMRMDLHPKTYTTSSYTAYIHGSAEVIGLMCLRVFVHGNDTQYEALQEGAVALGSAYQKINFLRDLADDYVRLDRIYFPDLSLQSFDEGKKREIIDDIKNDLNKALPLLYQLPKTSKKATLMSYVYYNELLRKLERTPAEYIKHTRIRIPNQKKILLLFRTLLSRGVGNE